jgi:hypothetical protein
LVGGLVQVVCRRGGIGEGSRGQGAGVSAASASPMQGSTISLPRSLRTLGLFLIGPADGSAQRPGMVAAADVGCPLRVAAAVTEFLTGPLLDIHGGSATPGRGTVRLPLGASRRLPSHLPNRRQRPHRPRPTHRPPRRHLPRIAGTGRSPFKLTRPPFPAAPAAAATGDPPCGQGETGADHALMRVDRVNPVGFQKSVQACGLRRSATRRLRDDRQPCRCGCST